MTNARQLGAYPSLIPGNQEVGEGQWDVIEIEGNLAAGTGEQSAATSKQGRILKLPKVVLRHDHWIRYHELTHVERPSWKAGKNQLRNRMRQMLEEVALDGQCLLRDGIDLRYARDFYDWSKRERPDGVYNAAANFFQVWTSAQVSQDQALLDYFKTCVETVRRLDPNDPTGHDLQATLQEAAQAVFNDYSSGNCEDWADIVTAKLLGVPKEEIPDAPEYPAPPQGGGGPTGGGASGDTSSSGEPGPQSGEPSDPGDDSDKAGASPTGPTTGGPGSRNSCPACDGEGVDEDGEDCDECGGTGESSGEAAGGQATDDNVDGTGGDTAGGTGEGAQEGDAQDAESGEGLSEWDTPPVELDKQRHNDPMDFGFDPLAREKHQPGEEPELPPLKTEAIRDRAKISDQQLQEAIDQERVNRKQGEASQAEELTSKTPFGAVDIHRHTMSKGTSQSVALGWRSSEMGATVRYPSQLFNSGRVFAKRAPGGSIILDGSGSMSWHAQHIMDAQKVMPNLYVAVYSHHGSAGYWRASHGYRAVDTFIARYCVLAQKGVLDPQGIEHKENEWQHTGGNSGADPASLWYAARWAPKPIVWVSDGMVSFGEAQNFYKQCDAVMRQHKIVRVLTIEDAIDYLLGKAVPGWHQSATVDTHWVRLGQTYMGRSVDPVTTEKEADRWTRLRANSRRR